mmetsp:Transcript_29632/g.55854  ORF Transcript_29632/g.55854 Transcript_29632/m.55854 type:complete len:587 (-) Transcript_29632:289-2049(-)
MMLEEHEVREATTLLNSGLPRSDGDPACDISTDRTAPLAEFTVGEAVDATGFGPYQQWLTLYVGCAWMSDALEMMLLSFLGPAVRCEWNLTAADEALVTTVVFLGMLIGANLWGWLADVKGRRMGFLVPGLVSCAAGIASALAPNFETLLLCRAVVGLGLGGVPVAFNLFLEFIPSDGRGHYLVLFESFWSLGAVLEAGLAWATMQPLGWRWLVGLSAVPLLMLMLFFPLLPESPHYLVVSGRLDEAEAVLQKMARFNGVALPPGKLVQSKGLPQKLPDSGLPTQPAQAMPNRDSSAIGMLRQMLHPSMRRTTLLLWLIFFSVACSYYGVVLLSTEIHVSDKEGSVCTPGGKAALDDRDYADVMVTTLAELPGLLVAAVLVERIGRIRSMAYPSIVCGMCMLLLMLGPGDLIETGLLFGSRASVMTVFTVIYIYAPEVAPTSVRGFSVGVANGMARIGGMIAPLLAVTLVERGGLRGAELAFLCLSLTTALAAMLLPIETRGRALMDRVGVQTETIEDAEEGGRGRQEVEMADVRRDSASHAAALAPSYAPTSPAPPRPLTACVPSTSFPILEVPNDGDTITSNQV